MKFRSTGSVLISADGLTYAQWQASFNLLAG